VRLMMRRAPGSMAVRRGSPSGWVVGGRQEEALQGRRGPSDLPGAMELQGRVADRHGPKLPEILVTERCRTLMRPPVVKRQKIPLSGFFSFLPLCLVLATSASGSVS
jgi:hypothetical protein